MSDVPDKTLLCELYQILGVLDAGDDVLDQVSAAIHGEPLPKETLLPYTISDRAIHGRRCVVGR